MKAKVKSYLQCKVVYEVVQVCPHGAPSCRVHSGSCSQADPVGGGLAYCKLCNSLCVLPRLSQGRLLHLIFLNISYNTHKEMESFRCFLWQGTDALRYNGRISSRFSLLDMTPH